MYGQYSRAVSNQKLVMMARVWYLFFESCNCIHLFFCCEYQSNHILWQLNRERITNILIGLSEMLANTFNHTPLFICFWQKNVCIKYKSHLVNSTTVITLSHKAYTIVAAQERGDYKSLDRNRNFLTNACSDCGSTEHSVWGFEDNGLTTTVTNFSRD